MECKPARHLQAALRQITGKTPWIYSFAHTVAALPLCMNKLKAALILRHTVVGIDKDELYGFPHLKNTGTIIFPSNTVH